jgi:hypothetical protein
MRAMPSRFAEPRWYDACERTQFAIVPAAKLGPVGGGGMGSGSS